MSTRAIYSFEDGNGTVHVYKHSDGYPIGAAQALLNALPFAWPLPRWEADEFAAAFVTANRLPHWMQNSVIRFLNDLKNDNHLEAAYSVQKSIEVEVPYYFLGKRNSGNSGGEVRLIPQNLKPNEFAGDAAYRYHVTMKAGSIHVAAYEVNYWGGKTEEKLLFRCKLSRMMERAKAAEMKENAPISVQLGE